MRNIQLPPPSASDLMLDILSGYGPQGLSVQALCKAGRVMDIAETNVRVALNRLTNQSKIFSPQRGFYAIDNEGYALHEDVENWWTRENLINDWAGHWVGAVAPHEKKTSVAGRRKHLRALDLCGFREFMPYHYIRPNNLEGGVEGVRRKLFALGVVGTTSVYEIRNLSRPDEVRARSLWMSRDTVDGYDELLQAVRKSSVRLETQSMETAARESLMLGRYAIKFVMHDPLVPEELMPGESRRALVKELRAYQVMARKLWAQLIAQASSSRRQAVRPIVNDIFLFQNI